MWGKEDTNDVRSWGRNKVPSMKVCFCLWSLQNWGAKFKIFTPGKYSN